MTSQESRKLSIERCIQSMVHACVCHDTNCRLPSCQTMKRVVRHVKSCKRKTNGDCYICKQFIALSCYHAKHCKEAKCPVPFCLNIRHKLRQQQLSKRLQMAQMLARRMACLANRGHTRSLPQSSQWNSNSPSEPSSAPPHTSPHPPQPGIGMKPSAGPPIATLQAVQQVQAAGVNYGKGNPVVSPPTENTENPLFMPSQQMQAQMQKPMAGQTIPGVPSRMLQDIGGLSSCDGSGYNPQGIQGQPCQPPQPQQMSLHQPNQLIGPGDVSNTMGNPSPPMGPPQGLLGPGPAQSIPRPTQALQQLFQMLKTPTSPQQQEQVLQILKSSPELMTAFIKQRIAQQEQDQ